MIGLRNEGQAPAIDASMGIYFHHSRRYTYSANSFAAFDDLEMKYRREYTSPVIAPQSTHLFRRDALRSALGEDRARNITFRVRYRDGLGSHLLDIRVWLGGNWSSEVFTFTLVSYCRDGRLDLLIDDKAINDLDVADEATLQCPAL